MELDATYFLLATAAVLLAAISKGGFGSGAAFLAAPLLANVIEPAQAVALMLPLLMLMDLTSLRTYWRQWSWPHARLLMAGAVPGVILGALLFHAVSADGLRLMVGGIALGFVAFQLARARGWLTPGAGFARPAWGGFWGTVSGFTSFISHAGGPPAAMYLLASRLEKTLYQATTVLVFWWVNLIKVPPYAALGMFTADALRATLILAPVAVGGVYLGAWLHRRVSAALFFGLTYTLLAAAGAKLVWDALS